MGWSKNENMRETGNIVAHGWCHGNGETRYRALNITSKHLKVIKCIHVRVKRR